MKRWLLWIVVGVLLGVGGGWATAQAINTAGAEPVEAKQRHFSPEKPPSERMQEQLMDPNLDVAAQESLREKIEMARNIEQQQQAAEAIPSAPKTAPDFSPEALMKAIPPVETGIFPGPEAMIRPSHIHIINYWQGVVDGEVAMVFAGSAADNPQQGLIVIAFSSLDPNVGDIRYETAAAPEETGALRVVSEDSGLLTLEAQDGAQLIFTLSTKTFAAE